MKNLNVEKGEKRLTTPENSSRVAARLMPRAAVLLQKPNTHRIAIGHLWQGIFAPLQ